MTKRLLIVTFILTELIFNVNAQTTMLSSNPLKKHEVLLFNMYQFYETTTKYNWKTEQWDKLNDTLQQSFHKTLPMVGYGITDKLSMFVQFPMSNFIQNEGNTFYFDDILLMTRYAVIPSSSSKTGLTLIGAVRLPTGKTGTNKNFSDGSTDIIIGEIFSTKWYGNWRTHIKSDFTLNTKNVNDETLGNEMNLIWKQDYKWKNLKFSLTNQYYYQAKKLDKNDVRVDQTQKERLTHLIQAEYQCSNGFIIKPKFQIPSYSVGGSNYSYKLILELVYKFSCASKKEQ